MSITNISEAQKIREARPDSIQTPTVDQRRLALLAFASAVREERGTPTHTYTDVVPLVVPHLASPRCADPVGAFGVLVDAVDEQDTFYADPRGYADLREWRGEAADLEVGLRASVNFALTALLVGEV